MAASRRWRLLGRVRLENPVK